MKLNLIDRVISTFNPVLGAKRLAARKILQISGESIYHQRGHNQQTKNYNPFFPTDPNLGVSAEVQAAQQRSNGLYFENSIAAGIVNAMVDGAIGIGLSPQSYVKQRILNVSKEQIAETQRIIETYWAIWANSPELCDHYHKQTFGSLQREAYVNASSCGDMLQHIKIVRFGNIYLPQVQNIAGSNVKSPYYNDSKTLAGGVEVDKAGRETAFHVAVVGEDLATETITRVAKFGSHTHRLTYNLVMLGQVVPGQRRGRSILSRVAEPIIQMGRYSEAELTKAILQSYMTLFIETAENHEEHVPDDPLLRLTESSRSDTWHREDADGNILPNEAPSDDVAITMGPGLVWNLAPGQKASLPESKAPVAEFWKFMEAQLKLVGMAVGIPYEVLIKSFNSSYSASQASVQDAARGWKIAANEWAYKYCQPIYEQFVELLVRQNLIDCPGFLENPIIRKAWCSTEWHGPAVLNVDPRKSVESSVNAITNHLSTHEIEARKLFGHEWEAVLDRLVEENEMIVSGLGQLMDQNGASKSSADEEEDDE